MRYIVLLLLLLSGDALSGTPPIDGCHAANLACAGEIDRIYLDPNGEIRIPPPVGYSESQIDCNLAGGQYFTIKRSHPHFNEMYSMLLTAHTAGKLMYLRYLKDSPDCEIWYTVIY